MIPENRGKGGTLFLTGFPNRERGMKAEKTSLQLCSGKQIRSLQRDFRCKNSLARPSILVFNIEQ